MNDGSGGARGTAAARPQPREPDAAKAASAGLFDVVSLLAQLGVGKLRSSFDAQAAGCRWARAAMEKQGATTLRIGVAGRTIDLIGSRERSSGVLAASPAGGEYGAGKLKKGGMSFLAPHALTIADGEAWHRCRTFNEEVLGTGATHALAQAFLERVRAAFDRPAVGTDGIRAAMARAMTGIVLGEGAGTERAADDVAVLFDVVQSPLRRKLLGFRYRGRRQRLYAAIARCYDSAADGDAMLLALARRSADGLARDELLHQVPHWMFTFTGSGTDLLARTLALITSRPPVRKRVLDELAATGSPSLPQTIERLDFLNACLLETGRLFPPVTRTFHRRASGGNDIVHYFPLLQRDDALGATVHDFVPDRWLESKPDAAAAASNLFLRGPRACPGADLILFVCRAALARMLGDFAVEGGGATLARDPLPLSFPEREARFTAAEATT